jgi:hypothetical protein
MMAGTAALPGLLGEVGRGALQKIRELSPEDLRGRAAPQDTTVVDVASALARRVAQDPSAAASKVLDYGRGVLSSPGNLTQFLGENISPRIKLDAVSARPQMQMAQKTDLPESAADYRGQHKAPTTTAASADDLTKNEIYPSDVYSRPDWYEYGDGLREMRKIQQLRGNPEAKITIYRAVPKNVQSAEGKLRINAGDWVTTNKKYAKQHGESSLTGEYKILSKTVRAKDIVTNGDSIFEWGYNPIVE